MPQRTVTVDGKSVSTDGSIIRDVIRDKRAVAVRIDGIPADLSAPLAEGQNIQTVSADSDEGIHIIRHSAAHVMAEAVKQLFPDAKPTIGPATEDGFYYDFDRDESFTPEDLEKIEKKMEELVKADLPFTRKIMSRQEAETFFEKKGEPYKAEICLLYTSDAADDLLCVDLGGRRIITKKKQTKHNT